MKSAFFMFFRLFLTGFIYRLNTIPIPGLCRSFVVRLSFDDLLFLADRVVADADLICDNVPRFSSLCRILHLDG